MIEQSDPNQPINAASVPMRLIPIRTVKDIEAATEAINALDRDEMDDESENGWSLAHSPGAER